jgi:hypothetical protein
MPFRHERSSSVLLQVRQVEASGELIASQPAHAVDYLALVLLILLDSYQVFGHPCDDFKLSLSRKAVSVSNESKEFKRNQNSLIVE